MTQTNVFCSCFCKLKKVLFCYVIKVFWPSNTFRYIPCNALINYVYRTRSTLFFPFTKIKVQLLRFYHDTYLLQLRIFSATENILLTLCKRHNSNDDNDDKGCYLCNHEHPLKLCRNLNTITIQPGKEHDEYCCHQNLSIFWQLTIREEGLNEVVGNR